MIRSVFVDMDMVLADFITGIERKYDCQLPDGFGYDIGRTIGRNWDALKWDLDKDFWADMPLMPWAQQLMKWLTHEFEHVYVLTHAEPISGFIEGKLMWLHLWFPEYIDKMIVTKHKSVMARPTTMLIDDYPAHCKAWRAHRGKAVEVPSRWKGTVPATYNIFNAVASEAGISAPNAVDTDRDHALSIDPQCNQTERD